MDRPDIEENYQYYQFQSSYQAKIICELCEYIKQLEEENNILKRKLEDELNENGWRVK